MANKALYLIILESPLGNMIAGSFNEGICLLGFDENPIDDLNIKSFFPNSDFEINRKPNSYLEKLKLELHEYFEGKKKEFSIPLVLTGTDFQQKVWTLLQTIPFGTTQTYKQQSDNLNQPLAIRAMAHANGQNPLAILIPCHRVIGTNGKLTGYAGGLWRKKWLLEHERNNSPLNGTLF